MSDIFKKLKPVTDNVDLLPEENNNSDSNSVFSKLKKVTSDDDKELTQDVQTPAPKQSAYDYYQGTPFAPGQPFGGQLKKVIDYGQKQRDLAESINTFLGSEEDISIKDALKPWRLGEKLAGKAFAVAGAPVNQSAVADKKAKALEDIFEKASIFQSTDLPEGLKKLQSVVESIPENASATEKVLTFGKEALKNPTIIRDLFGTSIAASPEALGIGIIGTVAGAIAGFPFLGGILSSMASTYAAEDVLGAVEVLQQHGVDINNPESLLLLASDQDKVDFIKQQKTERVATMTLVEGMLAAASFGIAKYGGNKILPKIAGGSLEVAGQGGSELAGGIASQEGSLSERLENIDPIDIAAEVIAGAPGSASQLMNIFTQKEINKVGEVASEITSEASIEEVESTEVNKDITTDADSENESQPIEIPSEQEDKLFSSIPKALGLEGRMKQAEYINVNEINEAINEIEAAIDEVLNNETLSEEQKDFLFEILADEQKTLKNYEFLTETETRKIAEISTKRVLKNPVLQEQTTESIGLDTSKKYKYSDNRGGGVSNGRIKISKSPDGKDKVILEGFSYNEESKKEKPISSIILGDVDTILEKGNVNFSPTGDPVSVTIPLSGGRQVTIDDSVLADKIVASQSLKQDYDPEFFDQEYVTFTGEEQVEVKLPIDERKTFTKEESEMTGAEVLDVTPTSKELDQDPIPKSKPKKDKKSIADKLNEKSDPKAPSEPENYINEDLSPEDNAAVQEIVKLTEGGKKITDKDRNKARASRKLGLKNTITDNTGGFVNILKRVSGYNEKVLNLLVRLTIKPLRESLNDLELLDREVTAYRNWIYKNNMTEKDRARVSLVAAAKQFDSENLEEGLKAVEKSINNALKLGKKPKLHDTVADYLNLTGYTNHQLISLYKAGVKNKKDFDLLMSDIKNGKDPLNEKQQKLYDYTREYYESRFASLADAIGNNHGEDKKSQFIQDKRDDYFRLKAIEGFDRGATEVDVSGTRSQKTDPATPDVSITKTKKDTEYTVYELDIFKNLQDYSKQYYIETSLTPAINKVATNLKDKALRQALGNENINSIVDAVNGFNRQKRGFVNNVGSLRFLDKARASYITTTLSTLEQVPKQTISGLAAAMVVTGGNPKSISSTLLSVLPFNEVTGPDGSKMSVDDWFFQNVPSLWKRYHSTEHNYQIEKEPHKIVNPGSLEEKALKLSEATGSGLIRRPDYIAARSVFIADFIRRGGKFESPNADIIESALNTQESLQGANDMALGAKLFLDESASWRFAARASLTFMGFSVAQLVTLVNSSPHVFHSDMARRDAMGAVASMVGFAYASQLALGMMDEALDWLLGEDDEMDDDNAFWEKLNPEKRHQFIIMKGILDGTAGTIPIARGAAAYLINDKKLIKDPLSEDDSKISIGDFYKINMNSEDGESPEYQDLMYQPKDYGVDQFTSLLGAGYGEPVNRIINLFTIIKELSEKSNYDDPELVNIYYWEMMRTAVELDLLNANKYIPGVGVANYIMKRHIRSLKKEYIEMTKENFGTKPKGFNDAVNTVKEKSN